MITYVLAAAAFLTLLASLVYIRSARLRFRVVRLIDADVNRDVEAHSLAFSAYRKEAHSAIVYGLLATVLGSAAVIENRISASEAMPRIVAFTAEARTTGRPGLPRST